MPARRRRARPHRRAHRGRLREGRRHRLPGSAPQRRCAEGPARFPSRCGVAAGLLALLCVVFGRRPLSGPPRGRSTRARAGLGYGPAHPLAHGWSSGSSESAGCSPRGCWPSGSWWRSAVAAGVRRLGPARRASGAPRPGAVAARSRPPACSTRRRRSPSRWSGSSTTCSPRPTTSTSATAPSRATTSSRRRSTPRSMTPSSATPIAPLLEGLSWWGRLARRLPNGSVHRYLGLRAGRARRGPGGGRVSTLLATCLRRRRRRCSRCVGVALGGRCSSGSCARSAAALRVESARRSSSPCSTCASCCARSGPGPTRRAGSSPLAPVVLVATVVVAAAMAPLLGHRPGLRVVGRPLRRRLLAAARLGGLALGGLDTGTAFGGMGASRAVTIGALAEPALLVAILALSVPARLVESARPSSAVARPPGLAGQPAAPVRPGGPPHRDRRRERAAPGGQPEHPPRADDDPRGDGPRVRRTRPGPRQAGRGDAPRLLLALFVNLFVPWGIATALGPGRLPARPRGGRRQGRRRRRGVGRCRGVHGQAAAVPGARAAGRRLRPRRAWP